MKMTSQKLFYVFILIISLAEGLGPPLGRELAYYLILLFPLFLLIPHLVNKKPLLMPKILSFLFVGFLVLSIISIFFSVNIQRSLEQFLIYLSIFLIFIFIFNNKNLLSKAAIPVIFSFSFVFLISTLFLQLYGKIWPSLIPKTGYQFIFSSFGSHNHLGDFLILPLILSFYYLIKTRKKTYLLSFMLFFPFFLLSYSRSAYLSLIITMIIVLFIEIKKRTISFSFTLFSIIILLISFIFFFSTVDQFKNKDNLNGLNRFLADKFSLKDKEMLGNRDLFFNQAFSSIKEKPIFGVGPANFIYSSRKYNKLSEAVSYSSHNLILDIMVENGVLAAIFFLIIIILIVFNSSHNGLFFGFLAILINFQTDYTHTIYSFFLIFIFLAALIYDEKHSFKKGQKILLVLSFFVFLIANLILLSKALSNDNKYKAAIYFYPLNETAYKQLIKYEISLGNYKNSLYYLNIYNAIFKSNLTIPKAIE